MSQLFFLLSIILALSARVWSGEPTSPSVELNSTTVNTTTVEQIEQKAPLASLAVESYIPLRQLITVLSPHPLCSSKIDGFYSLPDNCSQYLLCIIGTGTVLDCPVGQVFDVWRRQCLPIEIAAKPCGNATTPATNITCSSRSTNASTVIADEVDCNVYHRCLPGGQMLSVACPFGMVFDNVTLSCQSPTFVRDCMPPAEPDLSSVCTTQASNGLYIEPNSCSGAVICLEGVGIRYSYPDDKPYFNSTLLACTAPPVDLDKSCLLKPRLPRQIAICHRGRSCMFHEEKFTEGPGFGYEGCWANCQRKSWCTASAWSEETKECQLFTGKPRCVSGVGDAWVACGNVF
jgi:hypothetical protein